MTVFHHRVDETADRAEQSLRAIAPGIRLGRGADPRYRMRLDGEERFTVLSLEVFGAMSGSTVPDDGTLSVAVALSGTQNWQVGGQSGVGTSAWLAGTDAQTFVEYGPMAEIVLFLHRDRLLRWARAFYGDEALLLSFDGSTAITPGTADYVGSALRYARSVAGSSAFDAPLVRATLYRHLALTVLESFRLRGDRRKRGLRAEERARCLRVASDFLHDHASLPITPEDAAAAAGLAVRDLDVLFRAHSVAGTGVEEHLADIRLAAAYEQLRDSDPGERLQVQQVAARWGFASPAQFSDRFLRRFGVRPSAMLRR